MAAYDLSQDRKNIRDKLGWMENHLWAPCWGDLHQRVERSLINARTKPCVIGANHTLWSLILECEPLLSPDSKMGSSRVRERDEA